MLTAAQNAAESVAVPGLDAARISQLPIRLWRSIDGTA